MIGFHIDHRINVTGLPRGVAQAIQRGSYAYFLTKREDIGKEVRSRMRLGVSAAQGRLSERESVVVVVEPGPNPSLRASSSLPQAVADEKGRKPGSMPPFGPNSMLRAWVVGTLHPDPKDVGKITRSIAFKIQQRGLPRPGDRLRQPFGSTLRARLPEIRQGLREVGRQVVREINRGPE